MKKLFAVLTTASLIFWLTPTPAKADNITLFSALQGSGTFACGPNNDSTVPCDLNGYYKVSFQVTSASGSVAEIDLQQRNTPADPWSTVLQLFNPGTNDMGYSNIGYGQMQVVVIWTSGSLTATLNRLR